MTKQVKAGKSLRRYSQQYKAEALALVTRVGVPAAAKHLGIIFEYVEVDYKWTRRHSANGYISPEAFEA